MSRIIACVTIDTEPDCDAGWRQRTPLEFNSFLTGVPRYLRPILDRFGVPPVYLITPGMLSSRECLELLKVEIGKGAEIGSHLHAGSIPGQDYRVPEGPRGKFMCYAYPDEIEYQMLEYHDKEITRSLGIKATSFRAGKYGADINTMLSLMKLGYTVDTSVTPHINWASKGGPDFSGYPDQPYFVDTEKNDFSAFSVKRSILEIPVTIHGKRAPLLPDKWFFYRWLRPSFMAFYALRNLIDDVIKMNGQNDSTVLCMMFHSMELIPGTSPYVIGPASHKYFFSTLAKVFNYLKQINAEFLTLSGFYDRYK